MFQSISFIIIHIDLTQGRDGGGDRVAGTEGARGSETSSEEQLNYFCTIMLVLHILNNCTFNVHDDIVLIMMQ